MRLSSPIIRGLEYTALLLLCNFLFSLSLSLSLFLSSFSFSYSISLSFYSLNISCILLFIVRLDPACGRASALHLHPVKCRKLVKAQAVMCRIASCIAGEQRLRYSPAGARKTKHRRDREEVSAAPLFRTNRRTWVHLTEINVLISLFWLEDDMLMSW